MTSKCVMWSSSEPFLPSYQLTFYNPLHGFDAGKNPSLTMHLNLHQTKPKDAGLKIGYELQIMQPKADGISDILEMSLHIPTVASMTSRVMNHQHRSRARNFTVVGRAGGLLAQKGGERGGGN